LQTERHGKFPCPKQAGQHRSGNLFCSLPVSTSIQNPSTKIHKRGADEFRPDENPLIKTECHFDLKHFEAMYKVIVSSSDYNRYKIKGLAAIRVEMIVVTVILICFVFKERELE
jgi:hypothetical protein